MDIGVENFKIIKRIGKGMYGNVYLVRHRDTNILYALKALEITFIKSKGQMERTKTERNLLENLNHEFVVKLHYCFLKKN